MTCSESFSYIFAGKTEELLRTTRFVHSLGGKWDGQVSLLCPSQAHQKEFEDEKHTSKSDKQRGGPIGANSIPPPPPTPPPPL